jgi:phage-related protein
MKQIVWLGNSRKRLKDFPLAARRVLGQELLKVQLGGQPVDWRAMPIIGTGSIEIRIHSAQEYSLIYIASYQGSLRFALLREKNPKYKFERPRNCEDQIW